MPLCQSLWCLLAVLSKVKAHKSLPAHHPALWLHGAFLPSPFPQRTSSMFSFMAMWRCWKAGHTIWLIPDSETSIRTALAQNVPREFKPHALQHEQWPKAGGSEWSRCWSFCPLPSSNIVWYIPSSQTVRFPEIIQYSFRFFLSSRRNVYRLEKIKLTLKYADRTEQLCMNICQRVSNGCY